MTTPETLIYAELLANIRQISVIAVLPTAGDSKTTASLSPDRKKIILQHKQQTISLKLPGQVDSTSQLQSPGIGKKELSWRLPLAGQPSRPEVSDADTPWPAKDLDEGVEIACKECKAILIENGTIKTWKDLPRENWAEMMEFWHCHKPDEEPSGHAGHSHSEDPNATKGYGASSKFVATSGVGFVDISTFLLAESNCQNFESSTPLDTTSRQTHQPLCCSKCHTYIGHHDVLAAGLRLYKYRLQLTSASKTTSTIPAIQIHTTQLSSIITSQVTSRLILIPSDFTLTHTNFNPQTTRPHQPISQNSNHTFLSLWILSPSIRYSAISSSSASKNACVEAQPAMKVFYQTVSCTEAEVLMAKEGVEEVVLPWEAIVEIKDALEQSKRLLPPGARVFREWDVGLLERFGG